MKKLLVIHYKNNRKIKDVTDWNNDTIWQHIQFLLNEDATIKSCDVCYTRK